MAEERTNFYKLISIVVDLGTEVLLQFLKMHIPAGDNMCSFLNAKKPLIKSLEKRKVLNDMQVKVLNEANPDGSKFDISLLFTLIRNLTNVQPPNSDWDAKAVPSSERSAGALLVRLKKVRNEAIAHKANALVNHDDFNKYWKETGTCLVGLAAKISSSYELEVQRKVIELESRPLMGDEKNKVDSLLKWQFEEKCAEMTAQLEEITNKINSQGDVSGELKSMRKSLDLIHDQVKSLSIQQATANLKPFQFQTGSQMSTASTGAEGNVSSGPASTNSDGRFTSQEHSMVEAEINNMKSYIYNCMMVMCSGNIHAEGFDTTDGETTYSNPNAFTDDEIKEYSEELGSDWEIFAIYLGYKQQQIDILKDTYVRQIETLLLTMLRKWHEVVAKCENENPKDLLAAAFAGIRDNLTASKILGGRERLQEVKRMKPKPETAALIKKIKFATRPTMPFAAMLQMSAAYSSGISGIGYGNMNPNNSLPSGTCSQQQALPPSASGSRTNICRGEGVGDSMNYSTTSPTTNSNSGQFKKTEDDTFPQNVVGTLSEFMRSVGCIIITYGNRGTCFRVGDRYVITALHVVQALSDQMYSECVQLDPSYSVPAVFVNFNENPDVPPQTMYQLKPPCYKDPHLDIAILEIENCNCYLPQRLPISRNKEPIYKVDIIGYGHPNSSKKQLDPNCGVLPVNHDQVVSARNFLEQERPTLQYILKIGGKDEQSVQRAFDGFDDPAHFLLNSFFEHGASGAPAIDHSTPNSLKVVGIYTQGFPAFFFDLPKDRQPRYQSLRFEMCSKSSSLYEQLKITNKDLADEIFGCL